jgi:hypothetical protein
MQRLECVAGKIKAGVHDRLAPTNRSAGPRVTRYQRQLKLTPNSAGLPLYRTTVS